MPTRVLRGIAASPGIAIGPIYHYTPQKLVAEQSQTENVQQELDLLKQALAQASREIRTLQEQATEGAGSHEAGIFEAHEMFLNDPELLQQVETAIQQQHLNAAFAWQEETRKYVNQLQALNDEYLSARAVDMEDVAQRVLRILQGKQEQALHLTEPAIIVATDLTPSDTVRFDSAKVRAFCIATGGPTSHVAILAKAMGIPAITGLGRGLDQLQEGLQAIVDGTSGELLLEPDVSEFETYRRCNQTITESQQNALTTAHQPAHTRDGKAVEVFANIGSPEQVAKALAAGAEGIGLLRTEFLFMDRATAPDEEEQTSIYRQILEAMGRRPVIVRTFDIGGDKPVPYLNMASEMNPFLGVRGIRLALAQPELLQTQLRALLKAGREHALRIMFPMVSSSEEIEQLRTQLRTAQETLATENIPVAENVQIGIMIEVPAAALMADVLAQQVDFFSIGTNDLAQYTLASDRTNGATAAFSDALHPAVLRLIQKVIEAAHKHNRTVGLCGELAGDPLAIPVLLGLGLDEFSMSPRMIAVSKQKIRQYSMDEARTIAERALQLRNAADVRAYLTNLQPQP